MDEQKYTCAICHEPVRLGGEPGRPEWVHEEDGTPLCTEADDVRALRPR
jgi:hypothetical protein